MPKQSYITKRRGAWEYRRVVPLGLRPWLAEPVPGFATRASRAEFTAGLDRLSAEQRTQRGRELNAAVETALAGAARRRAAGALGDANGASNAVPTAKPDVVEPRKQSGPIALDPDRIRTAFERWLEHETGCIRLRIFNEGGQIDLGPEAQARSERHYALTQPQAWTRIAEYDGCMLRALRSQGVIVPADHPRVPDVRQLFQEFWLALMAAEYSLRGSPNALWGYEPDPEKHDDASPARAPWCPTDYARQMARNGPVVTEAAGPDVIDRMEVIVSATTPFLTYVEQWKPHAGLKPRPLDQAASSLRSFDAAVGQPLEALEVKHVQAWIDGMINPAGPSGNRAVTVARKVGEVRNYWRYLQSVQIVAEGRDPFAHRRIKDPPSRKETRDDKRQKWRPSEVVALWERAASDPPLAHAIRIAAYSGARIEGVAQLKVTDIRIDLETKIRFMRMADKSTAGDRDVPIHPAIEGLIDRLVEQADPVGYLIHSAAQNKYAERSQPIGKRFGRMKTAMGYDHRYVFHSIRKTVASLFQDALVVEGVASDIVGHVKPGMTYGLYGGTTHMSVRAVELVRAIVYPSGEASANATI